MIAPATQTDDASAGILEYQLIEGIWVFGLLTRDERMMLVAALVRRELTPGQVVLEAGQIPDAITIVGYGVLAASPGGDDLSADILRFGARENLGESGPIAGVPFRVAVVAKTYAIVYELPGNAVAALLKEHPDVVHALSGTLADREREGRALMKSQAQMPVTRHGLASWIASGIRALHQGHREP